METTQSNREGKPRHAQVVPSFFAAVTRAPLVTWLGEVDPAELVYWTRKDDLSEGARRDMRQTLVRRTRQRAERLWAQKTGVRLAPGWQEALPPMVRKRVQALVVPEDRPLETWTLREIKEALGVPLEVTLGILARLESVYWVPQEPGAKLRPAAWVDRGPPVDVTPQLRELADEAISLRWVSKVERHDLRFGYQAEQADQTLADWLRAQLDYGRVGDSVPALIRSLLAADKMTAEEEAREIVTAAARECGPRGATPETLTRWIDTFLRRHISRTGNGTTLAELGDGLGVTRERVRQMCEAFEDALPELDVATPALDRVMAAAARVAPLQVDDIDEQLRRFIGEGAGLQSLVGWAGVLGRDNLPVECKRARLYSRGKMIDVTMVQAANAPEWFESAIRHVARDCNLIGCTSILRIAGRLALKEGLALGQEALESALESATSFRWLDKESGWFTMGDSTNCSVAHRVRKIMAVAQGTVGTDEIAGALAHDDQMLYRGTSTTGLATPPVHVLRELLLGWPWIRNVQRGRFVAGPGFDADEALTDAERALVRVIGAHDGVACRFELKEVIIGELGLTDVMLAALLGTTPIIVRLEHGLYSIRGRKIGNLALRDARVRLRARSGFSELDIDASAFTLRVTEATLRHEQYTVPQLFVPRLSGAQHTLVSASGDVLGKDVARVGASGALRGINQFFPTLQVGDQLRIEVLDDRLRVHHLPGAEIDVDGEDDVDDEGKTLAQ